MEKRDLRHLKRKELIDLIDKMQTENDLVSNVESYMSCMVEE